MSELERAYRWLLRAYPRSYRQYRADEMLETLLATADTGRRRPSLRESAALVIGGLRARTGVDRLSSRTALRRSALRLAALSLLAYAVALAVPATLSFVLWGLYDGPFNIGALPAVIPLVATVVGLIAAARSRYRIAFAAAVLAAVANLCLATLERTAPAPSGLPEVVAVLTPGNDFPPLSAAFPSVDELLMALGPGFWASTLAALAMLPLLRAPRATVARPWTWLAVTVAAVAATTQPGLPYTGIPWPSPLITYAAIVAVLLGTVIDSRIPVVASALLLVPTLSVTAYELLRWKRSVWEFAGPSLAVLLFVGLLAATLTASFIATRRRAAL